MFFPLSEILNPTADGENILESDVYNTRLFSHHTLSSSGPETMNNIPTSLEDPKLVTAVVGLPIYLPRSTTARQTKLARRKRRAVHKDARSGTSGHCEAMRGKEVQRGNDKEEAGDGEVEGKKYADGSPGSIVAAKRKRGTKPNPPVDQNSEPLRKDVEGRPGFSEAISDNGSEGSASTTRGRSLKRRYRPLTKGSPVLNIEERYREDRNPKASRNAVLVLTGHTKKLTEDVESDFEMSGNVHTQHMVMGARTIEEGSVGRLRAFVDEIFCVRPVRVPGEDEMELTPDGQPIARTSGAQAWGEQPRTHDIHFDARPLNPEKKGTQRHLNLKIPSPPHPISSPWTPVSGLSTYSPEGSISTPVDVFISRPSTPQPWFTPLYPVPFSPGTALRGGYLSESDGSNDMPVFQYQRRGSSSGSESRKTLEVQMPDCEPHPLLCIDQDWKDWVGRY